MTPKLAWMIAPWCIQIILWHWIYTGVRFFVCMKLNNDDGWWMAYSVRCTLYVIWWMMTFVDKTLQSHGNPCLKVVYLLPIGGRIRTFNNYHATGCNYCPHFLEWSCGLLRPQVSLIQVSFNWLLLHTPENSLEST